MHDPKVSPGHGASAVPAREEVTFVPAVSARRVPEVLAPAGGRDQFFAALNAGADAVYLGLKAFNARARAENFTLEDLETLVPLAHRYGMRVLVAVNVLIKEAELPALIRDLAALEALEVDAILVQDLAVARLVREHFPRLRLHASTQLAVHNLAGVLQAVRYGFRRVVLARELTIAELRKIRAAVPLEVVELEAFCHGSLCYSYSGLCFFSGANDARSGNRGECAYTCRQPYRIVSEPGHGFLFSMRDLDTSHDLGLLVDAGVDTLKIEGRKKDAQYVATTVRLYRQRLDDLFGRSTLRDSAPLEARSSSAGADLEADLKLSFHRDSTGFFLKGRYFENVIDLDNPTHQGLRVGAVTKVAGRTFRVVTEVPLERFDGMRILPAARAFHARPQHGDGLTGSSERLLEKYENEVIQFSLREMRVAGTWVPAARPGSLVEIEVPSGCDLPRPGDIVYKWRSADLKRRVEALTVPPRDYKLRPYRRIDVTVTLREADGQLEIEAVAGKQDRCLTRASIRVPARGATGRADLAGDLADLLGIFGDEGFLANTVRLEGPTGWFVPRSRLKELKHALARGLAEAYEAQLEANVAAALAAVGPSVPRETAGMGERRFQVKVDRLEYLEHLAAFLAEAPDFPLSEVVLEPKKMFLAEPTPERLWAAVEGAVERLGVPVRLALPTVIRAWDEAPVRKWTQAFHQRGGRRLEVGNPGAIALLERWEVDEGVDLAGDFTLYALNSEATRFWQEQGIRAVTLSIEDDLENLRSHLHRWPDGVTPRYILFKDTPLFIAEACSLTALHDGCPTSKVCGYRTLEIENPAGERFYVAHEQCKSIVYAREAFSVTHRQPALLELGIREFRLDFLTRPYDREAFLRVMRAAWRGQRLEGTHTANFDRRLV